MNIKSEKRWRERIKKSKIMNTINNFKNSRKNSTIVRNRINAGIMKNQNKPKDACKDLIER